MTRHWRLRALVAAGCLAGPAVFAYLAGPTLAVAGPEQNVAASPSPSPSPVPCVPVVCVPSPSPSAHPSPRPSPSSQPTSHPQPTTYPGYTPPVSNPSNPPNPGAPGPSSPPAPPNVAASTMEITSDPRNPSPGKAATIVVTVSGSNGGDRYGVPGVQVSLKLVDKPGGDAKLNPTSVLTDASGTGTTTLSLSKVRGHYLISAAAQGLKGQYEIDNLNGTDNGPTRARHQGSALAIQRTGFNPFAIVGITPPNINPLYLFGAAAFVLLAGFVAPWVRGLRSGNRRAGLPPPRFPRSEPRTTRSRRIAGEAEDPISAAVAEVKRRMAAQPAAAPRAASRPRAVGAAPAVAAAKPPVVSSPIRTVRATAPPPPKPAVPSPRPKAARATRPMAAASSPKPKDRAVAAKAKPHAVVAKPKPAAAKPKPAAKPARPKAAAPPKAKAVTGAAPKAAVAPPTPVRRPRRPARARTVRMSDRRGRR